MSPIIEGLRGLGALMVLLHHYTFSLDAPWAETLSGLHFFHAGVDLFFVLTGYLFAPLLLGQRVLQKGDLLPRGKQQHSIARFFKRRAWRLYPLYGISLLIAVFLTPDHWTQTAQQLLQHLLFLQAAQQLLQHLLFLQAAPWQDLPNIRYFSEVYWTLSVEVAFYLFVACGLALPSRVSPKLRFWSIGLLALLGFLFFYYAGHQPLNGNWVLRQAQLPALLIEFWFGMAVYWILKQIPSLQLKRYARYYPLLLILATGLLLVLYRIYPSIWAQSLSPRPFGWFNLSAAFAFALLLGGLQLAEKTHPTKPPRRTLYTHIARTTALQLGAVSYGVYLLHGFMLPITAGLFGLIDLSISPWLHVSSSALLTFLIAGLLHRWVEAPCRDIGRR